MKFSVLINNYNYARYLRECVDSVLKQTLPPCEIIVVDDGSTDDSFEVLRRHYANNKLVKIIAQPNGGQFAAIGAGIAAANGDIVCLLDADDCYQADYLASLSALYHAKPELDLVFCRFDLIGNPANFGQTRNAIWLEPPGDYDYGHTALLTYFYFKNRGTFMIGNVTSCLSLKLAYARKVKLGEVGRLWQTPIQADYALLLGVSLLGAHKYYFARELVNYRVHGENSWAGRPKMSAAERRQNRENYRVLFDFYRRESGLNDESVKALAAELQTVPAPLPEHIREYGRLSKIFSWQNGQLRVRRSLWQRIKDWRWVMTGR